MKVENRKVICPHCEQAVLELTDSSKLKGDDHQYYICPNCDSTYEIEQVEYFSRMGANE